jgi:hypothetical protein
VFGGHADDLECQECQESNLPLPACLLNGRGFAWYFLINLSTPCISEHLGRYHELRDSVSLAVGLAGLPLTRLVHAEPPELLRNGSHRFRRKVLS